MGVFRSGIPRVIYLQSAVAPLDSPQHVLELPAVSRLERFDTLGPGGDSDLPEAMFAPGGLSTAFPGVGVASLDGVDASQLTAVADEIERALGSAAESQPGRVHPSSSETVFEDGDAGLRIFSFLHRQAHLSRAEFSDLWRGFIDTFMAAEELRRSDLPVSAICEAAGFNDVCYFTRQFLRHTGLTPGRFRRSCTRS